ncbi:MAG: FkbM family methyltransferase [Azospirillaceae bacterium]
MRNPAAKMSKALRLARVARWRAALRHGVAATIEHDALARLDPAPRTVVDIGANRGQFAVFAAELFPEATIHAFEPLAEPADRFARVFRGESRVHLHRAALGPESGRAAIHVSARADSSSLLPITERQTAVFPGTQEVATQEIAVATLGDHLRAEDLRAPALLKIDVQGFERQAIEGCGALLDAFDHVYIECSFVELYAGQALADEIVGLLRGRGFALAGIHNPTFGKDGEAIQADFLFRRAAARAPSLSVVGAEAVRTAP